MIAKEKVLFTCFVVAIGFFISVLWHFEVSITADNHYPLNTFIFRPEDQFMDFLNNFDMGRDGYSINQADRAVFPFFMLISRILYFIIDRVIALKIYLFMFLIIFTFIVGRELSFLEANLKWLCTILIVLFSYPFLISMSRANFENASFILLLLFVLSYRRGKFLLSSVLLGLACAIKPYAFVFFPLYLSDRKWREMIFGMMTFVVIDLISLLLLPGNLASNLAGMQTNLALYNQVYVVGNEGIYFSSGLFNLLKVLIFFNPSRYYFQSTADVQSFIQSLMKPYLMVMLILFALVCLILVIHKIELWKKVAVLMCCMNLLPYICGDYRLLYVFLPLLLFFPLDFYGNLDKIYLIIFTLLLIPKSFIHFTFNPVFNVNPNEVTESVLLNPLLMLALLALILVSTIRTASYSQIVYLIKRRVKDFHQLI